MRIFIACSSSNEIDKKYIDDCKILLEELFSKGNDMAFGASSKGLMKVAYDTCKSYNRDVIGICPEAYKEDLKNLNCSKGLITKSLVESTNHILENSDAILVLPGGFGSVYELFMSLETKRAKEHNKPIVIFNSYGYYDELINFMLSTFTSKFMNDTYREYYYVANNIDDVIKYLNNN